MFKINNEESSGNCVQVYPTFGLDLIVDSESETLPSFDEVMMENNDDDAMIDLDSFDPLETAISVLGMNGSAEKPISNKPRIGPASFKKKLVEEKPEKDPLADDPVEEKKPAPRIGPASFKKKLAQDPPSAEVSPSKAPAPTMSAFDMLRNNMRQDSSTPKAGPASFKRKLEETPIVSSPPPEKPTARVGPASFKRKLDEESNSSAVEPPKVTSSVPRIGPASFKKKIESNSISKSPPEEEKKVHRVGPGPASFKRQLEKSKESPEKSSNSSNSRSPSPSKKSTPEKSPMMATKGARMGIGPARFKRKLEEKSADSDDDDVSYVSRTSNVSFKGSDVGSEKATEKSQNRPGPARFKKPVEEVKLESDDDEDDEDSKKPTRGLDSSNIKSLTLGFIPMKKGGAIATKRKSRSPADSPDAVTCESCNIVLPSASALRAHDRATHKPVRIAQHLKVKNPPRAKKVDRPKYCEDSDEDEIFKPTGPGESLKCYKCMKTIPEDDYIEHLVAHDQEAQAELDAKNSTAELSKGAKLSRRYVFADVNDERNKADDAVLRCFLCTDHLFLNRSDYKHHTQTKHCIIMDNIDGESD